MAGRSPEMIAQGHHPGLHQLIPCGVCQCRTPSSRAAGHCGRRLAHPAVHVGQRLTPHVRHRQKYVDVPVPDNRAFVFRGDGRSRSVHTHTLREFVAALDAFDVKSADRYLRRGDFSRWIADVFGDHALARALQGHEQLYVQSGSGEPLTRIAAAIRSRYELTEESDAAGA